MKKKTLLALLILLAPTAVALFVYLNVTSNIPTSPEAVGLVRTIAGAAYPGFEDGSVLTATFSDPFGIVVDKRGNVIVADAGQSNRIRRITVDGKVETIAGSSEGFADGDAGRAQFNTPSGIAIDKGGNLVIADTSNNRIRRLSADGRQVTTVAGSGVGGFKDGPGNEAQFDGPIGIAVDKQGNIFVADAYNDCIRQVSADGRVTTVAGTGLPGSSDGQAASASFDTPVGVAVDRQGNIFVADAGNHAVRKITAQGEVTTIVSGMADGGQGSEVRLSHPVGIVVTHDGFLFITDEGTGRIIRIDPEGTAKSYAGRTSGYADGIEDQARMNGPTGIAIDRKGVVHVADSQNYLIRQISPTPPSTNPDETTEQFLQPSNDETATNKEDTVVPKLNTARLGVGQSFPWPLNSQHSWHEVAGVVGEARGVAGGVAVDHLHSGLDIHGSAGEAALSVYDEKVTSPISNWDFEGSGEGMHVGLFTYIHIRIGRNASGQIQSPEKFKPRTDSAGKLAGVRVRRGARFRVGDLIGSLNRLNHVHLNLGPWNAQANPLALPFVEFKDTVAPTIEKIEIESPQALVAGSTTKKKTEPSNEKRAGRLLISGDVAIVVTAYDRVDGNAANRKLGLYRIGYQLLGADGTPVKGFEQPLMNIEFNRLPADGPSVQMVYANGSGVSAYGTPTKFRYIITNRVRNGEARYGLLRSSSLASGNYVIKVIAEDYAGNRAEGRSTELAITVK